jgi:lipid A 3-O-deacylase
MKKIILIFTTFFLLFSNNVFAGDNDRSLLEKLLNKDLPGGTGYTHGKNKNKSKKNESKAISKKKEQVKEVNAECRQIDDTSLLEKILRKDLPGGKRNLPVIGKKKCAKQIGSAKVEKTKPIRTSISNNDLSAYVGTFDIIDKEGDDQTSLFGLEHRNPDLFRDTPLGKFSPISGAFMTGNSSVYLYTGIEGQYGIGPLKILPSFSPGYYEKGDGKDLGSVLEFKSEIKIGFDILENSKIGYSYSHISNNDWGKTNPGTDNQQITFSKNF